ncbi:hypothetical protein [Zunongwangia pacifica]|uniref:Uncharacterized protein n=1 Tax=Zunongwangia pacifica TaxID=2911062 RepID=A0A9X1ZPA1_9FLAO|nr:hypothetical protein [Zunongwangia pacifica]MCL6218472.1 hypothetical protein [Zunongwangia pacifica]
MITKKHRKLLEEELGKRGHIAYVMDLAIDEGITKKNGEPYSRPFFSLVYTGKKEHEKIENLFWAAAMKKKNERLELEAKRKKQLQETG